MNDDDWGYVEPSELFLSSGKTQSLKSLVDKLQQVQSSSDFESITNRSFPIASTSYASEDVKVIKAFNSNEQNSNSPSQLRIIAPRILKQRRGLVERAPNFKRVTFEIERFVVDNIENKDEKASVEADIAVRLGAAPQKKKGINYKTVKMERKSLSEKKKIETDLESYQLSTSTALNKFSKKIQKKKKIKQKNKK